LPAIPVIAEESAARGYTPAQDGVFILVDALDGTSDFIARRPEFTINIALIEHGAPRVGAVYAPALGLLWIGGASAYRVETEPGAPPARDAWRRIETRTSAPGRLNAVVSRLHLDEKTLAFLDAHRVTERVCVSSSLKFCRIAEGGADVYPRFSPTMEWDIAAGDAVLRAAGGIVLTPEGGPFSYGKAEKDYHNGPFIAWGDAKTATLS
jgi:3'(2'), 5'-bisphosphate nucleotidase